MNKDGSGWNRTRIDQVIGIFKTNEEYKPFVDEFNKVLPKCKSCKYSSVHFYK